MRNNKLLIWLITTSSNPKRLLYLNEHFSRFGKKNNVEVILENITWERIFKALVEGFKFNTGPDIMQIGTSWVRIFTHMGYLAQVPDDIKIKPSINEGINTICKQDGKQYAVPWKADTIIMAGRKDYMLKYGIKERDVRDWEGLKEFGKKFKELREKKPDIPDPLSIAFQMERDTLQRFSSILWSRGWKFPDLEKIPQKILTEDLVIDTMKYFAELKMICDKSINDTDKHPYQVNEDFYRHGLSVFYIGSWYGIVERINSNEPDNDYYVLPFPTSTGKSISYGGGSVLGVSSKSKNKEKAWKLVEYLVSEEFVRRWVDELNNVPAFGDKFWEKRFEDERIRVMYEQTVNSMVYPLHPAWVTIENELIKGVYYTIRELIRRGSTEIEDRDLAYLEKIDRNVKEILELSWEMRQNV
ncbi:MAG: extracellular solute-binding protein [Halanaerobiaceae bacterium]|jgi:multiple sugar transport system substrate-binding protein|nr:extracellular solute-binding protein [Halanaerobiaceae bacterium]